jgi:DNA polymerase (family 10)
MEAVFQITSRAGTALEMNAILQRLDMKDIHAYCAREMEVKMVLSTDAHSSSQLGLMRFAIGVTQGVWCGAGDLINAVSRQSMESLLNPRNGLSMP